MLKSRSSSSIISLSKGAPPLPPSRKCCEVSCNIEDQLLNTEDEKSARMIHTYVDGDVSSKKKKKNILVPFFHNIGRTLFFFSFFFFSFFKFRFPGLFVANTLLSDRKGQLVSRKRDFVDRSAAGRATRLNSLRGFSQGRSVVLPRSRLGQLQGWCFGEFSPDHRFGRLLPDHGSVIHHWPLYGPSRALRGVYIKHLDYLER